MHWHILGAGAIGCLYAARLASAGCRVTLLLRNSQRLDAFHAADSAISISRDGEYARYAVAAQTVSDAEPGISHLLVTTKAHESESAISSILPKVAADAQVVLLQNGAGHQHHSVQLLAPRPVWAGVTTAGVRRSDSFTLLPAGAGTTRLGPLARCPASLPDGWARIEPPVIADAQIENAIWQKLAVNAAINPLTAIHGCLNGDLQNDQYRDTLETLCREIESIATRCGYHLFDRPLYEQVLEVARQTALNRSSMLEDVSQGRRSEIEFINGFLARTAREQAIDAPLNLALYEQIAAQDSKESA
ncbi:ketopantoate reductase family protein [Marinobacterium litorale]|jgi:2-dehydropantoate 2-reductase|uniref:ketopantoate reductase family protein n=1 Tax=Marinobacterium litorale TaxID=404770 RepID=UPI0003F4C158|nr:2-dehydropantoate 2-reductase [Marinobacterium litorale]